MNPLFSIGIDPGKQTGFAIYNIATDQVELMTVDFWNAFDMVTAWSPEHIAMVVIEVPDTKHIWQTAAASPKALQRQGVNVGSVIREAELIADGLERKGYLVKRVNPRKKVDAAKFKSITGYLGKSNQHMRDAGLLCWRRK